MNTLKRPGEILSMPSTASVLGIETEGMRNLSVVADVVFFASLLAEESEPVRVAVVYHQEGAAGLTEVYDDEPDEDPPLAWNVTRFGPRPFTAVNLAKFSRGLEYGRQLVVVGGRDGNDGGLMIDGVARRLPRTDGGRVIRIAAPRSGVIAFERGYREILRFEAGQSVPPALNVLGNTGPIRNSVKLITGDGSSSDGLFLPTEMALRNLVRRMRATHAGGILAILPERASDAIISQVGYLRHDSTLLSTRVHDEWSNRGEIINDYFRAVPDVDDSQSYSKENLADAASNREALLDAAKVASDRLEAEIEDIARLSAIDGAVLAGPAIKGLAIYGAGYVIPNKPVPPQKLFRALDIEGTRAEPYTFRRGARHGAAFSFAFENPGAVAFVISEDGPVSCALRVGEQLNVWSVQVLET
jgi:hypothetical protein